MLERVSKPPDLQNRFTQRLSLFLRQQTRKILLARAWQVTRFIEDFRSLRRRNSGPFLECRLGRINGLLDVLLRRWGYMIDEYARGGIPNFCRPAFRRVTLFARNDQFRHMRSGRRNNDAFRFQVIFQSLRSVLSADTAELHSAARHLVI